VKTVWREKFWLIMMAGYFLIAIWLMLACCYHITERGNPKVGGRFDSLLSSMWYSLVFMLGEFPINGELTPWGKVIAIINMLIAIGGVNGIPTGIIIDGYSKHMEAERAEKQDAEKQDEEEQTEQTKRSVITLELDASGVDTASEDPLDQLYLEINGFTDSGRLGEGVVLLLVLLNVCSSMVDTIHTVKHDAGWRLYWEVMEPLTMAIFSLEYALRLVSMGAHQDFKGWRRLLWVTSDVYAITDLMAVLPYWVQMCLGVSHAVPTSFLRLLRLFKVFQILRAQKFIQGINILGHVLRVQLPILMSLVYGVLVLWVLFSALMFYTERDNPIPSMREQYQTMLGSLWMTLLNMSGEYPIADYTTLGRIVSTCVAFVAIAAFGIAPAILADGIADGLADLDVEEDESEEDLIKEREVMDQAAETSLGRLHLFLEGQDLQEGDTTLANPWWEVWGVRYQFTILALIMVNTVCYIIATVHSIDVGSTKKAFDTIELVSVLVYTVDYVLRLIGSYGNPYLGGPSNFHAYPFNCLGYMFSFFGLIDFLSIAPWYISHVVNDPILKKLTVFRAVRLVRLLRLERYLPAFMALGRVFTRKYYSLMSSLYMMMIYTLVFASLLHHTEQHNPQTCTISGESMGYRYRNVFSSLFYTFLHLTGDYPLYKYSLWGKLVNFFMIFVGQILVGLPLGLIVDGFRSEMESMVEQGNKKRRIDQRLTEAAEARDVEAPPEANEAPPETGDTRPAGKATSCFSCKPKPERSATSTSSSGFGSGAGSGAEVKTAEEEKVERDWEIAEAEATVRGILRRPGLGYHTFRKQLFEILDARGNNRTLLFVLQPSILVVATMCMCIDMNEGWDDTELGKINIGEISRGFGYFTASLFAIEYLARIYACPENPKFQATRAEIANPSSWYKWRKWPRLCYMTDFMGVIDLLAWLPYFVAQWYPLFSDTHVILASVQILMVIKLDRILPAFTLMDDVVAGETARMLLCTVVLALVVWIFFAALLHILENHAANMHGSFADMPLSLFFTMILLGGEWCRVDFVVPLGEITGAALAIFGIGIVGLPISILFDAFSELEEKSSESVGQSRQLLPDWVPHIQAHHHDTVLMRRGAAGH